MDPRAYPAGMLPGMGARLEGLLAMLEAVARVESEGHGTPSDRAAGDLVADRLAAGGWVLERPARPAAGVLASRAGDRPTVAGGRRMLLLGDLATPGGVVTGVGAAEVLLDDGLFDDFAALTLCFVPGADPWTTDLLGSVAEHSDVALGLEPATARPGDRAAPPAAGVGRLAQLALQVGRLVGLDDAGRPPEGLTAAVAATGVPALSGLGPAGGAAADGLDPHSIVPRGARLAGLLARVGGDD